MPGIGVIHNPYSRKNRQSPGRIDSLAYILGHEGESRTTANAEELDAALADFKRREIDILAINGGDGTGHVTLTAMVRVWGPQPLPRIAMLRGGTLNTIPRGLGIRGRTEHLLYRLQLGYAAKREFDIIHRPLLRAGDRYGFLWGNGVIAEFMDDYYREGEPSPTQGVLTLARGVLSAITGGPRARRWFTPLAAELQVDGQVFPTPPRVAMLAATVPEIGVGFTPFSHVFEADDRFQFVALHTPPMGVVGELWPLYWGRPWHPRKASERLAKTVRIVADRPFPYILDGDVYRAEDGTLELGVGPLLSIIRP